MIAAVVPLAVVLGSAPGPIALLSEALGRRMRNQLRGHGVALVTLSDLSGSDLAAAVADEQAVTRAAAGRCRAMLVTGEHNAASTELLAEVAAVAPASTSAVSLVIERQDRAAEHAIVAAMRAGKPHDDAVAVDHGESVRTLLDLPFVDSVTPRPYELAHDSTRGLVTWVDELLAVVGLRGRLDLRPIVHTPRPLRAYSTYSPHGLRVGRTLLPELTTRDEYELLHDFLLDSFPAGEERLLAAAERAQIVARHREANRAFFVEHLPDLPPDSYGSDAGTALLGQIPVAVRLPRARPRVAARRAAGNAKRAVLHRAHVVHRDGWRHGLRP